MVTIVIAILFTISARTYISQRDRIIFNDSLINIMGMFRTARNHANTSYRVDIEGTRTVPRSGYGIYINLQPSGNQQPFARLIASIDKAGAGPFDYNTDYDEDRDITLEEYILPIQTVIQSFYFSEIDEESNEPEIKLVEQIEIEENNSGTEDDEYIRNEKKLLILFRPPLAEGHITDNLTASGGIHDEIDEIMIKVINPNATAESSKRCLFFRLNRIQAFPELISVADITSQYSENSAEYQDDYWCSEYDKNEKWLYRPTINQ